MTFGAFDSAILGPLFSSDPMRAVFSEEARVRGWLRVEEALARAEEELDLVPQGLADAIAAIPPSAFDFDALGHKTALAGVPVIPFVAALEALLPEALRGHVHRGATTQDILDTGLVLQMRDAFALIEADVRVLINNLEDLAATYASTPCVGRTLAQHAAPVTFGFKAAVWLTGVSNVAALLPALKDRVLVASLGGPVGTLTSLGSTGSAVAASFARHLKLGATAIAWHTIRTPMFETGAWLAMLLGALGKIAADVALMSSTDVGEIAEPELAGRGGSSAMPHKQNPVASIVIAAAHAASKGYVVTLLDAMAAPQERAPGLWQAEWLALPPLFGLVSGALREAVWLTGGLRVHPKRMLENLDQTKGLLFADAVASRLGVMMGRERAHELVGEAAKDARRTGQTLREALGNDRYRQEMEAIDLDAAFDLAPAVAAAAAWARRATQEARRLHHL